MKVCILSTIFAGAVALMAHGVTSDCKYERLPSGYDYAPVARYFNQCLEGQIDGNYNPSGDFQSDYVIDLSESDKTIKRVWEEWKRVNAQFVKDGKETTLSYEIPKLTSNTAFSYDIPVSLEPYVYEPYDPEKFTDKNGNNITDHTMMQYTLGYKVETTDPQPLLIFMHGSGEAKREWMVLKYIANMVDSFPSVYIVPRIPNGEGNYYRWYQKSKQWVWEKMIRQAMLRDDIDHDRIYFLGISEGAYGSQRLGSFYADYLGGVGPLAGGEPLVNAPCENLRNTYFNICTGSLDTTFGRCTLSAYAGEYLDRLQNDDPDGKNAYVHDVRIISDADHSLGRGAYYTTTPPALVEHSRVTNPKHVRWENFPMDGRYRNGFHNIRVMQRSESSDDGESRTYYTMDIDGNNIDMTVSVVKSETISQTYDDVPFHIHKSYTPATTGRFKVYLNNNLVDLSKEVTLNVNGQELFRGMLQPNLTDMVNSCADFYDSSRVFPVSIEVNLEKVRGA